MELLRRYSNLPKPLIPTQIELVQRPKSCPRRSIRRRLSPEQIDALCEEYRLGGTTRDISERYGIGKTAVTRLLRERGVPLRHQGLSADQVGRAVELYENGKSVAQVARALGLHPSSVYDALRRIGMRFRAPQR